METKKFAKNLSPEIHPLNDTENRTQGNPGSDEAFTALERGAFAALETYSNVHRGSGHNSLVSTHLFEQARDIVLEYLGLSKGRYVVIFCTPLRASTLLKQLKPGSYQMVSDQETGISVGVRALAVKRKALPGGAPFQTGGGTTKLVSGDWVIWAGAPDRFEAGTPAIINIIVFALALRLVKQYGKDILRNQPAGKLIAEEILYHDELAKYPGSELLAELRKTLIGRGVLVPTMEGARPFINLDNSASTPTFTPVWNAFLQTLRQPGNVKQEIIHEVRSIVAGAMGAPIAAFDVIFTSNTTEAINLAAASLSRSSGEGTEPVVLNTLLEHSSNDLPWRMIPGCSVIRLSVDAEGFIDPDELETYLSAYNQKGEYGNKRIRLVAISGASNVLGICNNIEEISRTVHRYGAYLLVDAAQLVAHREVDMDGSGIDYLAFSAHKLYAPFGCGVLLVRKGLLDFNPGELESIHSSGEENAGGIAALGKALVLIKRIGMHLIREEEQALTRKALLGMAKIPGLRIYGVKDPGTPGFARKVGVIVFAMKGRMPNRIAEDLALQGGIGVRYGCHCAHIIIKHLLNINPFLERIQGLIQTLFPKMRLPGLVRISFGLMNSEEDVDTLIDVLGKIAGQSGTPADKDAPWPQIGKPVYTKSEVQEQINDFIKAAALKVYAQP